MSENMDAGNIVDNESGLNQTCENKDLVDILLNMQEHNKRTTVVYNPYKNCDVIETKNGRVLNSAFDMNELYKRERIRISGWAGVVTAHDKNGNALWSRDSTGFYIYLNDVRYKRVDEEWREDIVIPKYPHIVNGVLDEDHKNKIQEKFKNIVRKRGDIREWVSEDIFIYMGRLKLESDLPYIFEGFFERDYFTIDNLDITSPGNSGCAWPNANDYDKWNVAVGKEHPPEMVNADTIVIFGLNGASRFIDNKYYNRQI
jgi:hypothetical protein